MNDSAGNKTSPQRTRRFKKPVGGLSLRRNVTAQAISERRQIKAKKVGLQWVKPFLNVALM